MNISNAMPALAGKFAAGSTLLCLSASESPRGKYLCIVKVIFPKFIYPKFI